MRACLRWQLRVLSCAWWLLLLLPVLALLLGWEAAAVPAAYLRRGAEPDPRSALALVLDVRHLFPLAGAVWASLFMGMDYHAEAQSLALSRGYRLGQVIRSKYLLFLLGCALVSATEQVVAVLTAAPGVSALPAAFLLRCFCLRLALDMGMMTPPALLCLLGRENLYIRLLGLVYGVALWRLMGSHYALWLQNAGLGRAEWLALWPLAALIVGTVGCLVVTQAVHIRRIRGKAKFSGSRGT